MLTITNEMESVETQFVCPHCGKENSFIAANTPLSCSRCHMLLPDILEMKFYEIERKRYHFDKGVF